jgi:hypothetical protein
VVPFTIIRRLISKTTRKSIPSPCRHIKVSAGVLSLFACLECRTIDASVAFRKNSARCDHGKLLSIHSSVSFVESVEKLLCIESFSNSRFSVQSVRSGNVSPLCLSPELEFVALVQQEPGTTGAEILNGIRFVRREIHLLLVR